MTCMQPKSIQWLTRLLQCESLPISSAPKSVVADIGKLCALGFIEKMRSGGGWRFHVRNRDALVAVYENNRCEVDLSGLTPRARAVALHGDAHKGKSDVMLILLSCGLPGAIWRKGGHTLDVYQSCVNNGIAAITATEHDAWTTDTPVALCENKDLILHGARYFGRLGFQGSVLYYEGNVSRALSAWLTSRDRAPSYVMFPDYDIVGLQNYLRLKTLLGDRLSLHVPPDLEAALLKYGDAITLPTTQAYRGDIETSHDASVRRVYEALLKTGRTLHQEALLFLPANWEDGT